MNLKTINVIFLGLTTVKKLLGVTKVENIGLTKSC